MLLVGSDNSIDPEDVRDELRTELLLLNGQLKKLDPDLDFSDALRPLLADTGPAVAHVPRLQKQKARMETIRQDLLRKAEENKRGTPAERSGSTIETFRDSNAFSSFMSHTGRHAAGTSASIDPSELHGSEVLPAGSSIETFRDSNAVSSFMSHTGRVRADTLRGLAQALTHRNFTVRKSYQPGVHSRGSQNR